MEIIRNIGKYYNSYRETYKNMLYNFFIILFSILVIYFKISSFLQTKNNIHVIKAKQICCYFSVFFEELQNVELSKFIENLCYMKILFYIKDFAFD